MKTIGNKHGVTILCVAIALLLSAAAAGAKTKPGINQQLQSAIVRVRKAKTTAAKSDAAERIVALTDERDCSDVTDETIQSMISLLDMPDDGVRMWVAAALGDIGPRAKDAVPKLLSIFAEVDCMLWDRSSASTIPIALKRMGAKPPPRNCPH